ncbi:putative filamin-B [Apostichopus japonicus]|uniref:Putative filamin-B n=1 Tax=Stichopus japonicus TaxID=307972 RepID=A0A2G8KW12_STIJA|nr:putative filamin-B [Apostichopus japonicus]
MKSPYAGAASARKKPKRRRLPPPAPPRLKVPTVSLRRPLRRLSQWRRRPSSRSIPRMLDPVASPSSRRTGGTDVQVRDNGDGTFDIIWTCPAPGDYEVDLRFGGQSLTGGPITVHYCCKLKEDVIIVQNENKKDNISLMITVKGLSSAWDKYRRACQTKRCWVLLAQLVCRISKPLMRPIKNPRGEKFISG